MQFADVRAWTFVPELPLDLDIPLAMPRGSPLALDYASELDFLAWRNEWVDLILRPQAMLAACEKVPEPRLCAGRWGPYAPRSGFITQSNEVMASYLQGLRGGRVGCSPAGRIAVGRYRHEPRTGHYIQMVSPARRPAVQIGTRNVAMIERGAVSSRGAYLFVHFGIFEVCRRCLPVRLAGERPAWP
jgi:hypothetical protein